MWVREECFGVCVGILGQLSLTDLQQEASYREIWGAHYNKKSPLADTCICLGGKEGLDTTSSYLQ